MAKKKISPDTARARNLLDELWVQVLAESGRTTSPEFDELIDCGTVSIRYCLPTQLLGKLTDHKLDCLCLQKGDAESSSMWDPRGFAAKVIVPWVMANQNVLGTSADPYVSKPLRKPRLDKNPGQVKQKSYWIALYNLLERIERSNKPSVTQAALLQTLRSVKKKLAASTFEYVVPERISLEQTRKIVATFLSEASGGDRGLSIAAALFKVLGEYFGLYSDVSRFVINATDVSTGSSGDIECFDDDGNLKLAIEVKERSLTFTDVKSGLTKARKSSLQELMFNAPRIKSEDAAAISEIFDKTWASGTNLYQLSIDDLLKVGLTLTGEAARRQFIEGVGLQLNEFNTQPNNRQRWKELLEEI